MRYSKPDLHFLSATKASLHCTDGSTPGDSGTHVCQGGDDVDQRKNCTDGSLAHGICNSGTGAGDSCPNGPSPEIPCVAGGVN